MNKHFNGIMHLCISAIHVTHSVLRVPDSLVLWCRAWVLSLVQTKLKVGPRWLGTRAPKVHFKMSFILYSPFPN